MVWLVRTDINRIAYDVYKHFVHVILQLTETLFIFLSWVHLLLPHESVSSDRFCSTSIPLIWYPSQYDPCSSAWFRFTVHHHLHHLTFWFIFCFLESSLISSIWAQIVSFLSFISQLQVDITDSQLNLPDSSYFRIVLYPFELRSLSDRVDRVCLRLSSAWSRHCQSWQFVLDQSLSQIHLLPISVDRVSIGGVRCAAEFVLRWSFAALFRLLSP